MTNALKLTADLIQRRDDMRTLLGAKYPIDVEIARRILRGEAEEKGISIAMAACEIGELMQAANVDPSLMMAAFVDECEVPKS